MNILLITSSESHQKITKEVIVIQYAIVVTNFDELHLYNKYRNTIRAWLTSDRRTRGVC